MKEVFFLVRMKNVRKVMKVMKNCQPDGRITRQPLVKEGHCHGVRNRNQHVGGDNVKKEEPNVIVGAIGAVLRTKSFARNKVKKLLDVLFGVKVQRNVAGMTKVIGKISLP